MHRRLSEQLPSSSQMDEQGCAFRPPEKLFLSSESENPSSNRHLPREELDLSVWLAICKRQGAVSLALSSPKVCCSKHKLGCNNNLKKNALKQNSQTFSFWSPDRSPDSRIASANANVWAFTRPNCWREKASQKCHHCASFTVMVNENQLRAEGVG